MKNSAFLSATALLFSVPIFAQTGPEYLTITLTNDSLQQPVALVMEFSNLGSNLFDNSDTTSIGSNNLDTLFHPAVISIDPFTISSDGNYIDKYDSRPILDRSTIFNFGFYSLVNDSITVRASSFIDGLSSNLSINEKINNVYLEDTLTGIFYQILDRDVKLAIPNSVDSRYPYAMNYRLHVIVQPKIQLTPVTCFGGNNGSLQIHNPFSANWNFTVYMNGNPINSSPVFNPDTALFNLISEYYTVVIYENNLLVDSEVVQITSPAEIIPNFTADNYSVFINNPVQFTNLSIGAIFFSWNFGDSTTDSIINPTHSYLSVGNFPVTLTASNANGCSATFTDTIYVSSPFACQGPNFNLIENPLYDENHLAAKSIDVNILSGSQKITIKQNGESQQLHVQLMNMNGQLIMSTSTKEQAITFDYLQAGIYLVNITSSNGVMLTEKIIVNN